MLETEIKNYILTEILKGLKEEITDDRPLIRDGLINSIGIMKLITFLNEQLEIELEDDDFRMENFESINSIKQMLASKGATAAKRVAS